MKLPPLTFRTLGRVLRPIAGLVLSNKQQGCEFCAQMFDQVTKLQEENFRLRMALERDKLP